MTVVAVLGSVLYTQGLHNPEQSSSGLLQVHSRSSRQGVSLTLASSVRCCDTDRRHIDNMTQSVWDTVYNGRRPLVLQGVMEKWPAMKKWNTQFFSKMPYRAHAVTLSQHTELDACLQQIQIRNLINQRHRSSKLAPHPASCSQLLDRVDAVPPGTQDEDAVLRDTVLAGAAPNRNRETTLGEFMATMQYPVDQHYGTYLFLETDLFEQHPGLWKEDIHPVPPLLEPTDFTPREGGFGSAHNLLIGRAGSRSSLHQDPYGETSWCLWLVPATRQ